MTCAKRRVGCLLLDGAGRTSYGENTCRTPVAKCPREPWEQYEKCSSVCNQEGHAEVVALENWIRDYGLEEHAPTTAVVVGHDHICSACAATLEVVGIRTFVVLKETVLPH